MKTHDEMGPLYGMSTFYFLLLESTQSYSPGPGLYSPYTESTHVQKELLYDIHTTRLHGIAASVWPNGCMHLV